MSLASNIHELLLGGSSGTYSYTINNSLRFRSSASAYLSRTPGSAGNRTTWTWSGWVKRGALNAQSALFSAGVSTSTFDQIVFNSSDNSLTAVVYASGSVGQLITTQVFRDPSAWYHIVVVWDSTNATASNRLRMYINGSQVTAFATNTQPTQNAVSTINSAVIHTHGDLYYGSHLNYFDGYLAEINFIDGLALDPSYFGATNTTTGTWAPKRYSGSYGTNGFYLPFSDTSGTTSGSNTGIGKDFSGNGNYWTTNNISLTAGSTYDAMLDSPTPNSSTVGNYAVLNSFSNPNGPIYTISNGNLNYSCSASAGNASKMPVVSSIGMSSGKWYCEATETSSNSGFGVTSGLVAGGSGNGQLYAGVYSSYGAYSSAATYSGTTPTFTTNDIIGLAFDVGLLTLYIYKNGTLLGSFTGLESTVSQWFFLLSIGTAASSTSAVWNFGQRPFTYTPPTGYKALQTYNLPTPAIKKGNQYFDATTYSGSGATQSITNSGSFQPDFVWVRNRTSASGGMLLNSVVGSSTFLQTTNTNGDASNSGDFVSFNSGGFSVGNNGNLANQTSNNYVGWQWKAGGTAVTNTNGSISSQVSANPSAGFSVVTYTGTGANATVGHGLGVAPAMILNKSRNATYNWHVYFASLGTGDFEGLNTSAAYNSGSNWFNNASVSSTVFPVGASQGTATYVCYCFAAIPGYSAFGSYTGNGSTDGPFIYCGFRPRYFMTKCTSGTSDWIIMDTSRDTYNVSGLCIEANLSNAESTNGGSFSSQTDILSNGFKIRNSGGGANASGGTYIWAAFAENPFQYSLAR
jgi:Concanavalin A-like lectin/glucanases superfamily